MIAKQIVKQYRCLKCGNIFKEVSSTLFVKTLMPKCIMCNSDSIMLINEQNRNVENNKDE